MTASMVVATRKSKLALAQARAFMRALEETGVAVDELHVTTTGDREQRVSLQQIGGKGLFIKEIEEALLDGRAHVAVHSMKDVPAELASGLMIACVPEREDARDAVVTRDGRPLEDLPAGAKVGTSSLRRTTLLSDLRPDLVYVPLRGNVDTRLRRCSEGAVDAVVLATAGLKRLGWSDRITEVLEPEQCLPAIGQGALAIECRAADDSIIRHLGRLAHRETALVVAAERGVMVAAEGSCQVPIAGHATRRGDVMWLRAALARADGSKLTRRELRVAWPATEDDAFEHGLAVGRELRAAVMG